MSSHGEAPLHLERREDVLLLTLHRPERLNAVTPELYKRLAEEVEAAGRDPDLRALVITGAGRAFCVGADLKDHGAGELTPARRREYVGLGQRANRLLQTGALPVVAAVNGHAIGAGLELALSADLLVVAEGARLRLPEAALGTFVGGGVTYTLPRRVGEARARELLLLGEFFTPEDALEMGLANRVVPASDVLPTALDLASSLALRAPHSIRLLRSLLRDATRLDPDEVLRREEDALLECMGTDDWREGVRAFDEKRSPRFTGR